MAYLMYEPDGKDNGIYHSEAHFAGWKRIPRLLSQYKTLIEPYIAIQM